MLRGYVRTEGWQKVGVGLDAATQIRENSSRSVEVRGGSALVWLIFSFLLGALPGFFLGSFTALKLSHEAELLGRFAAAGAVAGGIIGLVVFGYMLPTPPHFPPPR